MAVDPSEPIGRSRLPAFIKERPGLLRKYGSLVFLVLLGCGWFGWKAIEERDLEREKVELAKTKDANGFVPLPFPDNYPYGKVMIVAPPNCPSQAGRRADALEFALKSAGIAYERTSSVGFTGIEGRRDMARIKIFMRNDPPLVFYMGKAKSDPNSDEVIAEWRGHNRAR